MEHKGQATKQAAILIGHRMYMDFCGLSANGFPPEPECFYDMWMQRFFMKNVDRTQDFREGIWSYFLHKLVEDRRKNS